MNISITVETTVKADSAKVWEYWNTPAHIQIWAHADDTWECGEVSADVRVGGRFSTIMRAKDGSASFDFAGTYTAVEEGKHIAYTMDGEDARTVTVDFTPIESGVRIVETFDMEHENSEELQRNGWQMILNNFKKHVEGA